MACIYTYQGKTYSAAEFDDVLRAMSPIVAAKFMPGVTAVPDAPMIADTKAWVSLGIKRAIQHAVSSGVDGIVFATGQQNADLYDLSKQVDEILYRKNADGTYQASAITGGKGNPFGDKLAESQLEDYVGKDIAQKIVAGEGAKRNLGGAGTSQQNIWTSLSGDGLRVGGEGMLAFYNTIVPSVANDVLKKLGGGKVGAVAVEGTKSRDELAASVYGSGETYRNLPSEQKRRIDAMFDDRQHQQPGFPIPESLKTKVQTEGLPLFAKGSKSTGQPVAAVQQTIDALTAGWTNKPPIVVASDMNDPAIPQKVRDEDAKQQSQGANGEPDGFIYNGTIYIIAGQLKTDADIVRVLSHEALGHAGLRGLFGDTLTPILKQIVTMRSKDVAAKAKQYGLDVTKEADRLIAAEEVLAEMAQSKPEMGFVKRAIAAIRQWLRDHGLKLDLTDADIIANYLLPARAFIQNGGKPASMGKAAFSRTNQTETAAFDPRSEDINKAAHIFGVDESVLIKDGGVSVYHGSKTPWASKFFDLYKIGGQSKAATEGYGAYFAVDKVNARVFGKNIYPLFIDARLADQFIDFEKKVSEQTDFVKRTLNGFIDAQYTSLQTWQAANKYLKERGVKPDGIVNAIKNTSPENISPLQEWVKNNDVKTGYFKKLFFGDSDPLAIDLYRRYAAMWGAKQFSNQLLEYGILGATFAAHRDLWSKNGSSKNVIIWDADALKGEGVGAWLEAKPDFNPANPDIAFSRQSTIPGTTTPQARTVVVGDSGRTYTPEQRAAMGRTGSTKTIRTPKEVVKSLWSGLGNRLAQGLFDQFRPVRDVSDYAYTLMRLSKGATGAFEAFMHHGKLSLRDGAFDADTSGGVLEQVFFPLGKESTDFLRWIAGNRAERLMKDGKENLFTKEDIAAFKSLADGDTDFDYTLPDGSKTRDRTAIYKDSLQKFNAFNQNVLDMAEMSGLIDGASRSLWEHEFYVPFYRAADEDGGVRGMNIKSGVIRQQAFQKLKGGEQVLNDLLENTLMNWAHLIDASAKNRAAEATILAAERMGAARKATEYDKHKVWFMDNGKKAEFVIEDPHLMEAVAGLAYSGLRSPVMDAMSTMKHVLTVGVTASPFFKVRNLIRDSVQAIATASDSDLSYNPLANVAKGFKLTDRAAQEYVSALAGGGLIRFGTMLEGSEAKRTRQLIKQGAKDSHILDNESKVRAFYDKVIEPAIAAYNELGNRGEEINRMALYDSLIKNGVDHATASLMARDLMDFSMQGTFKSIRFLTQVVPFMNARLQGMYKLGRAGKSDPARFAVVLGMVSLASLALLAAWGDDDDWKEREDWDRDNYWWFKIGGVAYRIPKPFEIGAVATLAERSAELLFDSEMTGERFAKVTRKLVMDQLAMNPVPQLFKPVIDLYANHDSFTDRDIETMGMENVDPEYRFRASTSMVARGISTAGNTVTADHFLSPVQVDHVVRSYFGWLGSFSVGMADTMIRGVSNEPGRPAPDYWKNATGGMVADLDGARSRYVTQMYDQSKEIEQAYGTWRSLIKQGKSEEAAEYREDNREELKRHSRVKFIKAQVSAINKRIQAVERGDLSGDEKRDRINELRSRQNEIAQRLTAD